MASPQLENGHTRIANELLDAFCRLFPGGSNAQVLMAIIRRTYGWNKKEDKLSISQIQDMTGLSRRAVIYALQNLEAQRFITVQRQRGRGHANQPNTVSLQKNYDLWVVQRKGPQYEKQLQKQRLKYQAQVVQGNQGSAKNEDQVVQGNDKGGADSLHPQKTRQNTNKRQYGEFTNVLLTDHEHHELQARLGDKGVQEYIERLSAYLASSGKRYKSHYATILNWLRRDKDNGKTRHSRDLPEEYERPPEYDE